MGLVIGTIKWKTTDDDDEIIQKLHNLRIKNKLKVDPDSVLYGMPEPGYTYFYAQLGGTDILWYGGGFKAQQIIDNFLNDAQNIVESYGVDDTSTFNQWLPM